MYKFLERYHEQILGVLSGFDRLVFHGTIRRLHQGYFSGPLQKKVSRGMEQYLWESEIRFKDYRDVMSRISKQVREQSVAPFRQQGRKVVWVAGSSDKDKLAKKIALEEGIVSGLVCALVAMEPGQTFEHRGTHMIVTMKPCPVVYHYQIHPEVGWMYGRIQSWFPFEIQVGINGREWLSRQMDKAGMAYRRQDNCFPWIEEIERAQDLMREQLKTSWADLLGEISQVLNPLHGEIFRQFPCGYYWTCFESEWATDVVFREAEFLRRLAWKLTRHAVLNLSSADVLRYLGRKVNQSGEIPANFSGEVQQDFKRREEGERAKFRINSNSLKFYDKAYSEMGSVLRAAETTLNANVDDLRVYRPKEGGRAEDLDWRRMRRGIVDLPRRVEVSENCNRRLMDALAVVDDSRTVEELTGQIQRPVNWSGRRVRALRPWAEDRRLLEAVNRGEFVLNGLRNRDLQNLLYDKATETPAERRRRSAAVSRQLRMLRAHGLIVKIPRTHRYQVTDQGRVMLTAVLTAAGTSLAQLSQLKAA